MKLLRLALAQASSHLLRHWCHSWKWLSARVVLFPDVVVGFSWQIIPLQLEHLNGAFNGLRPVALDIFHLLGYVSLNMAGFRKILKKYAKNVEPTKPQPGDHQLASALLPSPE